MSMTYDDCLAPRTPRETPRIAKHVLDQFDLIEKVCIITGGSRGIGYAVAEAFAEAGGSIILVYASDRNDMDEKAARLRELYGVSVTQAQYDVTDANAVENLISTVKDQYGRIDVFVANAGICIPKSIFEQTLEEYHSQMGVNVHGVYYCAKHVGKVFKEQGHGKFIITSSISGQVVTVPMDHTTYNMTKAAVTMLGKSLAREWRDFARVNIVSPGWIDTDMSDDQASINEACRMAALGRLGDPKELKAIYLYLATDASSFVTGAEFTIDGGYTLP